MDTGAQEAREKRETCRYCSRPVEETQSGCCGLHAGMELERRRGGDRRAEARGADRRNGNGHRGYTPSRISFRPEPRPVWEQEEEERVREWPLTEDCEGVDSLECYGDASRDGVECRSGEEAYPWWGRGEQDDGG